MTQWFVYEWGKPTRQKLHWVILRLPLLRINYYQNKRLQVKEFQYLIPTYSWILIPIPNWNYSVMTISHFQCMALSTWLTNRCADPSTRLNHQLEKDASCKVFQFITKLKIMKPFGHKTLRCTNTVASSRERWTRQILSPVTICINKTLFYTCTTMQPLTTLKIILIYV